MGCILDACCGQGEDELLQHTVVHYFAEMAPKRVQLYPLVLEPFMEYGEDDNNLTQTNSHFLRTALQFGKKYKCI